MPRPRVLNDLQFVKDVVAEYKTDLKPTEAGLCRRLKCCPNTIKAALKIDDDIADEIQDAYTYLVESHESHLWEKGNQGAHIFRLKSLRQLGYDFRDTWNNEIVIPNGNNDHKLIIEVIREPKTEV